MNRGLRNWLILLAGLLLLPLTACSDAPSDTAPPPSSLAAPPDRLIHDPRILERAQTIILVRVVGLNLECIFRCTAMRVVKAWKGPFSAGDVLHTPKGYVACMGKPGDCDLYNFQFGDWGKEFLIMSRTWITDPHGSNMPAVHRNGVWPAAESQALMAALDQAVKDSMPTASGP